MKQVVVAEPAEQVRSVHDTPGKAFGIWSFVLSFFIPVLAVIFGIIGLLQSRRAGVTNRFAIAGIVIGAVLIATGMIIWISFAAAGGS